MTLLAKGLLLRIARRCPTHDRSWPLVIRALEADVGMELSPQTGDLVEDHCNPRLIGCGRSWCEARRAG